MEWEEQGEWDAEAVQRRPDNISYLLLKCIIPTAANMHTQAGVRQYTIFSPQFPFLESLNSSAAVGACCCSPCLSATLLCVCVCY